MVWGKLYLDGAVGEPHGMGPVVDRRPALTLPRQLHARLWCRDTNWRHSSARMRLQVPNRYIHRAFVLHCERTRGGWWLALM